MLTQNFQYDEQYSSYALQYIEFGKNAMEPPHKPQGSVLPPSLAVGNQLNSYKTAQNSTSSSTNSALSKVNNSSAMMSTRVRREELYSDHHLRQIILLRNCNCRHDIPQYFLFNKSFTMMENSVISKQIKKMKLRSKI